MTGKVFCGYCDHFNDGYSVCGIWREPECTHPDNQEDTYKYPKWKATLTPMERNRDNNCPLYEEKTKGKYVIKDADEKKKWWKLWMK